MGVRYHGIFTDSRNSSGEFRTYRVLFDFTGYSGSSSEVRMGSRAMVIDQASSKEDLVGVVELRADFEITNALAAVSSETFFTENEKSIRCTVQRMDPAGPFAPGSGTVLETIFVGYVTPRQSEDPYHDGAKTIRISATDGIAYLKNEKFITDGGYVLEGINTWLFVFKAVLDKIGLTLPFTTVGSLRQNTQDANGTFEPMAFTNHSLARYSSMTYYEVLQIIATHWNARIVQHGGEWWMVRLYDLPEIVHFRKWAANGDYVSGGTYAGNQTAEHNGPLQPLSGGVMSYDLSVKKLVANLKLGGYKNQLVNPRFETMSGADLANWTEFYSPTVTRVGTGTAADPYKAKLSGNSDKVMEAALIYQMISLGTGEAAINNRITWAGKADINDVFSVAMRVNLNILGLGFPAIFSLNDEGKWVRGAANAIVMSHLDVNGRSKKSPLTWEITSDKISEIQIITGTGVVIPQEDWGTVQIEISLMEAIGDAKLNWGGSPDRYVQYYDLQLGVVNEALNMNSTEMIYTLTNSAVSVKDDKLELHFADMPDADQDSAMLDASNAITTSNWITTGDTTQREIVEHLMRERLAIYSKPPRFFDGDIWGHVHPLKAVELAGETGLFVPLQVKYDYAAAKATGRWIRLRQPNDAGGMTMAKSVKLRDGSEQPVVGVELPSTPDKTTVNDLIPDIWDFVNRIQFQKGLVLKKNVEDDELQYLKWESATTTDVTDYINPTALGFELKTKDHFAAVFDVSSLTAAANIKLPNVSTSAVMATDETAWMLGGNIVTESKAFGTTSGNFDIPIIRNNATIATVKSTGLHLTNLSTNYLPKHTSGGLANSQIFDNGTNVGIGDISPMRRLDIKNASGDNQTLTLLNNDFVNGTVGTSLQFATGAASGNTYYKIQSLNSGETTYGNLSIQGEGGNVGFGTLSPVSKFHASGVGSIVWGAGVNSYAYATIGDLSATGSSLFVHTQSLNSAFHSGFGVDGTYASQKSIVNLKAFGVKSSGGYNSEFNFYISNNETLEKTLELGTYGAIVTGTTKTTNLKVTNGAAVGKVWQCTNADGTGAWVSPLASERYIGEWAANSGVAPSGSPTIGDYWVVNTAGTYLGIPYAAGDEIYYNGTAWLPRSNFLTLPIATASILGGIKVGSGLSIDGTGLVTVNTLNQNTTGNAATATVLANTRNIEMTGDVAWNVNFNGSLDVTAVGTLATIADSGTGTFLKITRNSKGLVTGTEAVTTADISGLLDAYTKTESNAKYVDFTTDYQDISSYKIFSNYSGISVADINIKKSGLGFGESFDLIEFSNQSDEGGVASNRNLSIYNNSSSSLLIKFFRDGLVYTNNNVIGADETYGNSSNVLRVGGNIEYSGTLKPANQTPTANMWLKAPTTSTNAWAFITSDDITDHNAANKLLKLNSSGFIDSAFLPAFIDDVLEFANLAAMPGTGESGKIYVALDSNKQYRWSGSSYVQITDGKATWGGIDGTLSAQTDLQVALNAKATLASNNTFTAINTFTSQVRFSGTYGLRVSGGNTYNGETAVVNNLYFGDQSVGAYTPAHLKASKFMFTHGFVKFGGTGATDFTVNWPTERVDIDGNMRISGVIKPDNTGPSAGKFLKGVDADNMAWANITVADIENTAASGQLLGRGEEGLQFLNLEINPLYLGHKRFAVGTEFDNFGEVENLTWENERQLRIGNFATSAMSLTMGFKPNDQDAVIEYAGLGDLYIKATRDIYFENFTGGGNRMLAVTTTGRVYATTIPSGGGGIGISPLTADYIGFGGSDGILTGSNNFKWVDGRFLRIQDKTSGNRFLTFGINPGATEAVLTSETTVAGALPMAIYAPSLKIDHLKGGGAVQMMTIDDDGFVGRQAIPSGGGGGVGNLNDVLAVGATATDKLLNLNYTSAADRDAISIYAADERKTSIFFKESGTSNYGGKLTLEGGPGVGQPDPTTLRLHMINASVDKGGIAIHRQHGNVYIGDDHASYNYDHGSVFNNKLFVDGGTRLGKDAAPSTNNYVTLNGTKFSLYLPSRGSIANNTDYKLRWASSDQAFYLVPM
jgi:hypothetical protein